MKRCRFALILSLALIIVAGCSGLPWGRLPTLIPEDNLPTVVELTAQALIDQGLVTPPPTSTIDPDAVTPTSTITNTPTITTTPPDSPTPTLNFVPSTPEPQKIPVPLPQSEIKIISPAVKFTDPVRPKKKLNILLAIFLGTFGGLGLAFFFEYFDHRIHTPEELERYTGIPALGSIRAISFTNGNGLNNDRTTRLFR